MTEGILQALIAAGAAIAGGGVVGAFNLMTARVGRRWSRVIGDVCELCDQVTAYRKEEGLLCDKIVSLTPHRITAAEIKKEARDSVDAMPKYSRPSMGPKTINEIRNRWCK